MKEKDITTWVIVGIFLLVMLIVGTIQDSGKPKSSNINDVVELKADRYRYEAEQKRINDYIEFEAHRRAK